MTEDRVGNIAKAIGTVMAVIIIMLAIIAHAFGQVAENQPPSGQKSATHSHTNGSLQRFRLVRISAPAKILYIEPNETGRKIDTRQEDKNEIEIISFQVGKEAKTDELKKGNFYWVIYCEEDRYVYGVYKLEPVQVKGIDK